MSLAVERWWNCEMVRMCYSIPIHWFFGRKTVRYERTKTKTLYILGPYSIQGRTAEYVIQHIRIILRDFTTIPRCRLMVLFAGFIISAQIWGRGRVLPAQSKTVTHHAAKRVVSRGYHLRIGSAGRIIAAAQKENRFECAKSCTSFSYIIYSTVQIRWKRTTFFKLPTFVIHICIRD